MTTKSFNYDSHGILLYDPVSYRGEKFEGYRPLRDRSNQLGKQVDKTSHDINVSCDAPAQPDLVIQKSGGLVWVCG